MRTLISLCVGVVLAIAAFIPGVYAQDTLPKTVNGGVVNGRATSLPKPEYPETAKAVGASGVIAVNIVIDENGTVISAEAEINDQRERRDIDGTKLDPLPADPMLRESAENAARKARFEPTQLNGQPIRVKGRLIYVFVTGDNAAASILPNSPKTVTGGLLNGKATSLPAPEYPAAAKAVRAEGMVSVQIAIDETGHVISASAVSGHPLLRAAAEAAARAATFSPTFLSGNPVMVSGVLTYNFVLPKKDDQ